MKKRLLIVTKYMPFPLNSGGAIAQFEVNDGLRKHLDLIIAFPLKKNQHNDFLNLKQAWPDVEFSPYSESLKSKLIHLFGKIESYGFYYRFLDFIRSKSLSTIDKTSDKTIKLSSSLFKSTYIDEGFANHMVNILDLKKIDYVQLEFNECLPLVTYVPKHITKIFVHHELRFVREQIEVDLLKGRKKFYEFLLLRNKAVEIDLLKEYDKIVVLSKVDKDKLTDHLLSSKLHVSPFTIRSTNINTEKYHFQNKLVFIGGEGHFPNADAISWFLSACWKQLKLSHPKLSLSVIGKWSSNTIEKYATDNNIIFHGFVDDPREIMKGSIAIVPIRVGSGIRMKIIESVNYGIPFVTTSTGVEGLRFENNKDCIIADSPEEFNAGIIKIIDDHLFANSLLTNSALTLNTYYSFENIIKQRLAVYVD